MEPSTFKAPYNSYDDIRKITTEILARCNPSGEFPIDIDLLIEKCYGIDIIPTSLKLSFGIEAFTSYEANEIWIDSDHAEKYYPRYRFSLAHELGHIVLHKKLMTDFNYSDIDQYIQIQTELPEDQVRYLEIQANSFAALLLVPDNKLKKAVKNEMENFLNKTDRITAEKILNDPNLYEDAVERISSSIGSKLIVSYETVKYRIDANGLDLNEFL